ncbi:MAG TPA: NAD(P)/FAD-dependent oxidoreductase [Terriglobales bacterium]|nr:NAD(P)/FAD-dependent oxidoreductase [Terriglobales bacterium]
MGENEWDVILIGAGQNNFTLGTYLAKAGLRTVICESRLENGGRLASEEITMPGYWHNTLAYFQDNREQSPVWKELDWANGHHAEFVSPPVINSLLLAGGNSIACHRSLDATVTGLQQFSPKDAAMWRALREWYGALIKEYLIPYYYSPPQRGAALLQKLAAKPRGNEFRRFWQMTPRQVIDELFESDAVKTLILAQMAIPRGVAVDYPGAGIEVLKMIAGDERPELARGGSHSIAQVLQRAYVHSGGQIRAVHHVEKILVDDDGRATGIRLRDGREWSARLAVVSNSDPYSTLIDMVGEDYLPRTFIERVKDIKLDEFSYFQVHLALKAPVRYALHEANDPAVGQAMSVTMGPETPADLDQMWQELRAGEFPEHACLHAICPTAFDPLQAPKPKHAASVYVPVPFQLKDQKPDDWVKLKNGFMEKILRQWRRYATNLTDENIEMKMAMDPFYMAGRWPNMRRGSVWVARKTATQMGAQRPIEQIANYRTPIRGLYQVGAGMHPADAVIAGSGYNCWQIMKEDLKLSIA